MSLALSTDQEAPRGDAPSTPHDASAFRGASSSAEIVKRCRCGACYSQHEWNALALVGTQTIPGDEKCGAEHYELRNCARCRSTLWLLIEPIPATDRGIYPLGCSDGVYVTVDGGAFVFKQCSNHA